MITNYRWWHLKLTQVRNKIIIFCSKLVPTLIFTILSKYIYILQEVIANLDFYNIKQLLSWREQWLKCNIGPIACRQKRWCGHIKSRRKESCTLNKLPWEKSSGLLIGRATSSSSVLLTSSSAPISSNFTPISSGGTTEDMKLRSYSSFAKFCR